MKYEITGTVELYVSGTIEIPDQKNVTAQIENLLSNHTPQYPASAPFKVEKIVDVQIWDVNEAGL